MAAAAAAAADAPEEWSYQQEMTLLHSVRDHQLAEGLTRADIMHGIVPLLEGLVAEGGALHGFTSDACLDRLYHLRDRYRADLTHPNHQLPEAAKMVHALCRTVWLEQPLLPETMAAQKQAELLRLSDQAVTFKEQLAAIDLGMISLIRSLDQAHILEPPVRARLRHQVELSIRQIEAGIQELSDLRNKLSAGPRKDSGTNQIET